MWNAQSINNKLHELLALLHDNNIDVCFLTETWLTSQRNYSTASLRECGYDIYHYNRSDQRGGGAAILVKSKIKVKFSKSMIFKSFEAETIGIDKITFVTVYRNGKELSTIFFEEFYNFLDNIHTKYSRIIICGDFNFHMNNSCDSNTVRFNEMLSTFSLTQSVRGPTHKCGNTLDLIIHNESHLNVSNIQMEDSTSSDHNVIFFYILQDVPKTEKKLISFRNLKSIEIDKFTCDLSSFANNFVKSDNVCNLNEQISTFNKELGSILDSHAPKIEKSVHVSGRPKWMDVTFLTARRERRALYKKWKRSELAVDGEKFHLSRNAVHALSIQKQKDYYAKCIDSCDNSQKELYKICNKLLDTTKRPSLPSSEDTLELTNKFNSFFKQKITKIRESCIGMDTQNTNFNTSTTGNTFKGSKLFTFSSISLSDLRSIIKSNGIKTSERDPIPAALLGECLEVVLPALLQIVNQSLVTGSMDGLKDASITPLLKKVSLDHEILANYRPITNIPYLSKVIERVVKIQLNDHMSINNLHIPNQSGYKSHHSCETLLTRLTNDILVSMDKKLCAVLLLLDLSAAFDTVDHNLLLKILCVEIGLDGTVLAWFSSFLKDRNQRISINGTDSQSLHMPYGVPQGSVLGPVLFNIYVRNLINLIESLGFATHGYADDHQILRSFHTSFQYETLCLAVPHCISLVSDWMKKFFLKLNSTKSQVIIFTPNSHEAQVHLKHIFLNQSSFLSISPDVVNLGLKMDSNLTFSPHINMILSQCYRLIGNIAKIRKFLSTNHIKTLVNSIVVSKLDNCNSILYGISAHDLNRLQVLQNSCARLIFNKNRFSHSSELLRELHWLPVRQRVIFKILCLVHKCLNDRAPAYLSGLLTVKNRNKLLLCIPRSKSKFGDRAFSHSGPSLWNALPVSMRMSTSFKTFKSHLKHHLFRSYSEFISRVNMYK